MEQCEHIHIHLSHGNVVHHLLKTLNYKLLDIIPICQQNLCLDPLLLVGLTPSLNFQILQNREKIFEKLSFN